jgi:glycosyltransferase involved in cell wall biosynthesis
MAAGRPVVLAIDGVIRQVVEAARGGIYAAPGQPAEVERAIRTLAANPAAARQMGLQGRRYLEENFSRQKMAEKLLKMVEEMKAITPSDR